MPLLTPFRFFLPLQDSFSLDLTGTTVPEPYFPIVMENLYPLSAAETCSGITPKDNITIKAAAVACFGSFIPVRMITYIAYTISTGRAMPSVIIPPNRSAIVIAPMPAAQTAVRILLFLDTAALSGRRHIAGARKHAPNTAPPAISWYAAIYRAAPAPVASDSISAPSSSCGIAVI